MTYSMAGVLLRKIGGKRVKVRLMPENVDVQLEFKPWTREKPWPSPGLEAYIVPATCEHPTEGKFPTMVKVFKFDVPNREKRTRVLTDKLGAGDKKFHGVPRAWLGSVDVGGVRIIGHLTRQIGGDRPGQTHDFTKLKMTDRGAGASWDDATEAERREVALQVIAAVSELESRGIAHGDLSQGNLLIGPDATGKRAGTFCDFDGFHDDTAPRLPRQHNGFPVRPIGTLGYQHPDLIEEDAKQPGGANDNIYVGTDRFALAALICELVVWDSKLKRDLKRDTLLGDDEVKQRSLAPIDRAAPYARAKFPAGFALLEKALKARGMFSSGPVKDWAAKALPSPRDWEDAIRGGKSWDRRPIMHMSKQRGNQPATHQAKVELGAQPSARFDKIKGAEPPLDQIEYQWDQTGGRLEIVVFSADEVRVRRGGDSVPNRVPTVSTGTRVTAYPGDEIIVGGLWHFRFE